MRCPGSLTHLALILALGIVLCLAVEPALAQAGNPFDKAIKTLLGMLNSNVTRGIATIGVIIVGGGCLTGRIDWRAGATVIFGIVLVTGAAAIASFII